MVVIREPHNGVYYYADKGAESVSYKGSVFDIVVWRGSLPGARALARAHNNAYRGTVVGPHLWIVRKIKLHAGKALNGSMKKHTITIYGVYEMRK